MKHTIKTAVGTLGIVWIALAGQGFTDEEPTNPQGSGKNRVAVPAGDQSDALEQLRQRYQQARATFAKTEDYGKPYQESIESARKLIAALLNHWVALPEGSPDAGTVEQEIRTVFKYLAGHPHTERYNLAKSFVARTTWTLLAGNKLNQKQAAFMVELTRPQVGVRMNDKEARRGKPTEPLGWDVQAAHALALIRGSNDKQARDEIDILHDKVSINYARNSKGTLDYGPEAGAKRYRNCMDYLQLSEALRALQAAIADDREGAKKHVENARKLREALSPEATPLVAEVAQRVDPDKD